MNAVEGEKQISDQPLVNYIWINNQKALNNPKYPVCAIEMANIQRALHNANKYPEAAFQLWIDKKLLDDYSIFCLECFMREHMQHNNITLRDLQDIPDYANDSYFEPLSPTKKGFLSDSFNSRCGSRNVYSRADYARILVLDHCLQSHPERNRIIYSDIDCPDIRLPEVLPIMEKYGVAVHDLGHNRCASHGYIALATDNEKIRQHFPALKADTYKAAHDDDLGYMAFEDFLEALGMHIDAWHTTIGLTNLLPEIRTSLGHLPYMPPPAELAAWQSAHQSQANIEMELCTA